MIIFAKDKVDNIKINTEYTKTKPKEVSGEELKQKAKIKHSLYPTKMDWKVSNTEVLDKQHNDKIPKNYHHKKVLENEMFKCGDENDKTLEPNRMNRRSKSGKY